MSKKVKRFCIVTSFLLLIYVLAIIVVPRSSIWAIPCSFNAGSEQSIEIREGDVYEQDLSMPFVSICSVEIPMDPNGSDNVVSIDAVMSISDNDGNTLVEKKITSAYDTSYSFNYLPVNIGETYHVKLNIRSVGEGNDVKPLLLTDDNGNMIFTIKGLSGSSDNKLVFALMFLLVAVITVIFVLSLDKNRIGETWLTDNITIAVIILLAIYVICQFNDLFDIARTSLTIIDSFAHGHLNYLDYAYVEDLKIQSEAQQLICDYNFTVLVPLALALLPLYPIYGRDVTYNWGGRAVVIDLLFTILFFVLLSIWLVKLITKECGMDSRYLTNVRTLLITSSMLLYMTVGFGQIDIIYIVMIILALPFYYRKKYLLFSFIMSVAVAMKTLPVLIFVPLLLLAVKKVKDIVINMAVVMIIPAITKIVFGMGTGYEFIMKVSEDIYGYKNRIIDMTIGSNLSLFVLAMAVICIAAYLYKPDVNNKKEMLRNSMLIIFVTYSGFAAFVSWHQQWLIPLVFSFAFLLPFYEEKKKLLLFSTVAEVLFILDTNLQGVSTYMINYGSIPPIVKQSYGGTSMRLIMNNISPVIPIAINTAFAAILFYMAWYMIKNRRSVSSDGLECPRQWVIGRTGVLYGFILFYCWCFSFIG